MWTIKEKARGVGFTSLLPDADAVTVSSFRSYASPTMMDWTLKL